ncbi:ExbD/TolR family protein [Engelhardtia mirabilis]|uniref:Biopolymer transport protein ExbD/TolR n=1 Tax=Engelhardtia mirabilis TaxID=2528011 RepID=A0A518BI66_9BACT|nr:Biopolymer transport protein ExbD/TolR [Planctomycetes bacterium Pla133]QDV00988.1 Biopolymer transport protein ExbD/TolR [Planctomycetes bacterium Pla86]
MLGTSKRRRDRSAKRNEKAPQAEMEMTPMIDVTFLLLIFFMCTLQFRTLEGRLAAYLPKDTGPALRSALQPEPITIEVRVAATGLRVDPRTGVAWTGQGRFEFDGARELTYRVGPRQYTSPERAIARVGELHAQDPLRRIKLDARPGTTYADVIQVVDLATRVGLDGITFTGSSE